MDTIGLMKMAPVLFDSAVNFGQNAAVMISGPMGHGKTSVGFAIAKALSRHTGREFRTFIREPMLHPLDEVRGMGVPQRAATGELIAEYTWPSILPPPGMLEDSVLVLDEFSKADESVVLSLGNALLSRKLGDVVIPPTCFIICTGNRAAIDASRDMLLPAHVRARLYMVEWQASYRSWMPWAQAQGLHPMTIAFAGQKEDKVFSTMPPPRNEAFLTPRSLTEADALIRSFAASQGRGDDLTYYPVAGDGTGELMEFVEGKIGPAGRNDMAAYAMVGRKMPTWDDIRRSPSTAIVPSMDDQLGPPALHAVGCMIAAKIDASTVKPAMKYMERLPDEYQVPIILAVGDRFPGEAAQAGLLERLISNQDLAEAALIYANSR